MVFIGSARAYLQFARCSFQRRAAYRLANWTGIVVNFFFFLVHAQLFLALFGTRGTVAGWQAADAVRYFATSEALLMVLGVMSTQTALEFVERIRSGDVAVDLVRPVRLWGRYLAESYGSAAYYALMRASILYAAAVALYQLALPLKAEVLLAPFSIVLGVAIAATLMYLASASAFWTEQAHGPVSVLLVAIFFFGGIVVPLDFYPAPARLLANLLPFRGALYTPVALASGKLSGGALLFGLTHQIAWLAVLVLLAQRVERRGAAHLAVQGG
jgi:viologen exporter family transport system permease protein